MKPQIGILKRALEASSECDDKIPNKKSKSLPQRFSSQLKELEDSGSAHVNFHCSVISVNFHCNYAASDINNSLSTYGMTRSKERNDISNSRTYPVKYLS